MKHYIDKITKQMFGYEQNPNDTNLRELTDEEFEGWRTGILNSYNEELDVFEFIDKRDFETEKLNKYEYLKNKREESLETGIFIEETIEGQKEPLLKLIKGRTQDLADAMAVFMMLQNGAEKTYWFYSNGVVEEVNSTKMAQIYQSIGNFRSSQFAKESQLKTQVSLAETLQELDSVKWN